MHIAIVFNPGSGQRAAARMLGLVVSALASHHHILEIIDCKVQPDFERELSMRANEFDRVIVIGGDGTLNGVVNAIQASDLQSLPVALLPIGRGKDSARSLASWEASKLANGAFELGNISTIDLIRITLEDGAQRYAINASSIGLSADATRYANKLPRWLGAFTYVAGAARGMVPLHSFRLTTRIDGREHSIDNALFMAVCNGKSFGGGMYIAPEADPQDGLLDIVVAHNAHLGDLALQLGKLKSGVPFEHPALVRWQAQSVTIAPIEGMQSEADGDLLSAQPVRFEIAWKQQNWVHP